MYGTPTLKLATGNYPDTTAITEAFEKAAAYIHQKKGFTGDMLRDDPFVSLIGKTTAFLSSGIEKGLTDAEPSREMVQSLKESAGVFSGFKSFHEAREASGMLTDETGRLKEFKRYLNDVRRINAAYNETYLKTEYDFAVASAEMAARWEEDTRDADGRYLLQYRTAGDEKVREAHRALNGITLPASDAFWDSYYPPNGWNCRCTVKKVRAAKYPASDPAEALKAGEKATAGKHAEMFRFNPGKRRAAYPAYNSYTISKCETCKKGGYNLAKAPANELCAACPLLREQAKFIPEPTERGLLRVHTGHGDNEKAENIRIARHLCNRHGYEIDLLPRSDTKKCADAYNRTLKKLEEYKQNSVPTRNAIDLALRDANRKARRVVLLINSDISDLTLTQAIRGRIHRAERLEAVTIIKNEKDITYTREEMLREGFKVNLADLK